MQIWPPVVDPATLTRQVWDVDTARSLPGVSRALQVYGGLIGQAPLDQYRGDDLIAPRPPLLQLPDPALRSRSTFVRVHVEDYLLHGNAVHLVTARTVDGQVRSARWFPAHMWFVADPSTTQDGGVDYFLNGTQVPRTEVVHVQRGASEWQPWRGVGVVEEHLRTLNRAGLQEAHEAKNLQGGGVPSVAVIAPQPSLDQDEVDEAKDKWMEKFGGPGREPAILPNGTVVQPLSWSPEDSELTAARMATRTDLANIFNLDAYWLGGSAPSFTYQSPGPMFLQLLRISLEPVMVDLEQVWSLAWLLGLRQVRFDRLKITRDDFRTEVNMGAVAVNSGLMTAEEWRIRWGMPATPEVGELKTGAASQVTPSSPPQLQLVEGGQEDEEDESA